MNEPGSARRFAGKVAVVTAGGAGIGAATALRFAREGADQAQAFDDFGAVRLALWAAQTSTF